MKHKQNRRNLLKKMGVAFTAILGMGALSASNTSNKKKEVVGDICTDQDVPLFSGAVRHGDTLYIAGKGAHFEGDI